MNSWRKRFTRVIPNKVQEITMKAEVAAVITTDTGMENTIMIMTATEAPAVMAPVSLKGDIIPQLRFSQTPSMAAKCSAKTAKLLPHVKQVAQVRFNVTPM
jgi:hypothetical protein